MMSELEVHIFQSFDPPSEIGEAYIADRSSITNGIFAATEKRLRKLPFDTIALKQLVNGAGTKNPF